MASVTQTNWAVVGSRRVKTKKVSAFMEVLAEKTVEAGVVQLRVLAEESREMIIDKLFAADPQGPGRRTVRRPRRIRARSDIPTIARRPYRHEPLKPRTVARKARRDEDGRILIATGDYVESIKVRREEDPEAGVFYTLSVGDETHEPSGLPMNVIAAIHEFGTADGRVPARPHWRPVRRALIRRARALGTEVQAEAIRRAFREAR